jgi:hypothetical protein
LMLMCAVLKGTSSKADVHAACRRRSSVTAFVRAGMGALAERSVTAIRSRRSSALERHLTWAVAASRRGSVTSAASGQLPSALPNSNQQHGPESDGPGGLELPAQGRPAEEAVERTRAEGAPCQQHLQSDLEMLGSLDSPAQAGNDSAHPDQPEQHQHQQQQPPIAVHSHDLLAPSMTGSDQMQFTRQHLEQLSGTGISYDTSPPAPETLQVGALQQVMCRWRRGFNSAG